MKYLVLVLLSLYVLAKLSLPNVAAIPLVVCWAVLGWSWFSAIRDESVLEDESRLEVVGAALKGNLFLFIVTVLAISAPFIDWTPKAEKPAEPAPVYCKDPEPAHEQSSKPIQEQGPQKQHLGQFKNSMRDRWQQD